MDLRPHALLHHRGATVGGLLDRQTAFHQRSGPLSDLAACYRLRATNTAKFSESDWLDDHIACPGHNRLQLGNHSL